MLDFWIETIRLQLNRHFCDWIQYLIEKSFNFGWRTSGRKANPKPEKSALLVIENFNELGHSKVVVKVVQLKKVNQIAVMMVTVKGRFLPIRFSAWIREDKLGKAVATSKFV